MTAPSAARHVRVPLGDAVLHGVERGAGDPLVLLHGFTGSCEAMEETALAFADRYRVIAVDLPGHGGGEVSEDPERYRMEACVDDLHRALEFLGLRRVHLLGYSMGGRVALAFAVRHPERVESLVLVGASAGLARADERAARRAADEALAGALERDGLEAFVDRWMAHPLMATLRRRGPDFLARSRAQRMRHRARGLARALRGLGLGAQPPLHAALPALPMPVLLVVGAEDAKFRAIAEEMAAQIPRSRIAGIPEAGHAAHLENPEAFAERVRAFLDEHAPRFRDSSPS